MCARNGTRVRSTAGECPACVSSMVCVYEARVSERPCGRVTACVRSLYTREMSVAMHEHAATSPGAGVNGSLVECSLGVVHAGVRGLRGEGDCDDGGTNAG